MVDLTKHAAAIVQAIEAADCGNHLELTRLVDGVATYTVKVGDETAQFEFTDDAYAWIDEVKAKRKSAAILAACTALWNEAQDMANVGMQSMLAVDVTEAVARALYEEDDPWHKAWEWPNLKSDQAGADAYRRLARAAISAMKGGPAKPQPETEG